MAFFNVDDHAHAHPKHRAAGLKLSAYGPSPDPIAAPTNSTGRYPAGTSHRGRTGADQHPPSPRLAYGMPPATTAPTVRNQTTQMGGYSTTGSTYTTHRTTWSVNDNKGVGGSESVERRSARNLEPTCELLLVTQTVTLLSR